MIYLRVSHIFRAYYAHCQWHCFCPLLWSSRRWILQSFKCKLGSDQQQYGSVSKTEKPSENPTNGRISLKSSNYGRARSQITMVNFLPEHFLGGESAFGANRLGIIFTIAYSRLGVSGKSGAPLLRFSQIKWLIVVVGSPLALLVMWQIYQMIAVQWETAHCAL